MLQVVELSATGAALDAGQATVTVGLAGARLVAGAAAAATAVIRETNGSGRVLARLQCLQGEVDDFEPARPVAYQGNVHVTLTGVGATI